MTQFSHTARQKDLIKRYLEIYGTSGYGLGTILSTTAHARDFYRSVTPCDRQESPVAMEAMS